MTESNLPNSLTKIDPRNELLSLLPKNSIGAEIGTWKGDFAHQIIEKVNPSKIYLVDPYEYRADYNNSWYGGNNMSQAKMDDIYNDVLQRFQIHIASGKLEVLRQYGPKGLDAISESLDWVYIDGDHTYEGVWGDLTAAWRNLKKGGLICGDDYALVGWWDDGVTKAFNKFIGENYDKLKLIFVNKTQIVFEKI